MFGLILGYSVACVILSICATLAHEETWHTENSGMFRTLPQLHPDAYEEPCLKNIQKSDISKTRDVFESLTTI